MIPVSSLKPGAFSVPHGLGKNPSTILIVRDSDEGLIWAQANPFDEKNINLFASDANVQAQIKVIP